MRKLITVLVGLFSVFIAAGLILPALAKVREYGAMPSEVVGFYTLGIVLGVVGFGAAVVSLSRCKAA